MPVLAQLSPMLVQLFVVGFLFICVLMVLTVLIQRPQGGGLSGAFGAGSGGGGAGQTAFGARTGDALTVATIAIFIVYLLSAVGLVFAARSFAVPTNEAPAAQSAPAEGAITEDLGVTDADDAAATTTGDQTGDDANAAGDRDPVRETDDGAAPDADGPGDDDESDPQ